MPHTYRLEAKYTSAKLRDMFALDIIKFCDYSFADFLGVFDKNRYNLSGIVLYYITDGEAETPHYSENAEDVSHWIEKRIVEDVEVLYCRIREKLSARDIHSMLSVLNDR